MPLSRYQIRNEYGLADPELYRAADKDDPEAFLEGVAMAGLIGVLRQLGDLAEFAAEIFHDLHEEVMVTAARGHSLIVRVQQLESEFPTVEKAFLSQTSHSSFLYNPGIGWHPKMHVEQSLIMRGDLPRFVMDSYEECRGPPRLFLLDKFDVAGAGACLKRYTDPSFFKLEAPPRGTSSKDIQREKKIRKPKKKGSRWRNGETPEVLPMSHAKLHQLFLEERIENGITDPARRVKLRRRLNGFPFDIKSGKSYMDRFLKSPSPDHIEVHDIPVESSPSPSPPSCIYKPLPGIDKIKTMDAEKDSTERPAGPSPAEERTHRINSPIEELNEILSVKGSAVINSDSGLDVYSVREPCFEAYDVPSTPQDANSEKVVGVDQGSYGSVGDCQFDDVASEIENYMDALTTMESEIDTDTEAKVKNNLSYFNSRRQVSVLDVNNDQFQTMSSESQSLGNYTSSYDGNSSMKKGISSFSSSDTRSPSAPSDGEVLSCISSCDHQIEVHDTSSAQLSMTKQDPEFQVPGSTASDGATTETADVNCCSYNLINQVSDPNSLELTSSHASACSTETISHETHEISSSMSLNTDTTNYLDRPERDDSPSKVSQNDHFMNEFEVDYHEICQSVPKNSGMFGSSNSNDESSLEVLLSDYKGKADHIYQNSDWNVACMSCPIDPSNTNGENSPASTDDNEKLDEFYVEVLNLEPKTVVQSDLADISSSQREDSSPETSNGKFSLIELGPSHPNATVEVVAEKSYKQSLDETGIAKDYCLQNSDNGQLGQQRSVSYFVEEHLLDPVVSDVDEISSSTGETTVISISKKDILCESVDHVIAEVIADLPSMTSKQESSVGEGEYLKRSSDMEETGVMREASVDLNLPESDSSSEPSVVSGNNVQLHLAVPFVGAERESIEMALNATPEKDIPPGELTDYVASDSPLIQSKEGTTGSEQEHFERLSEAEDDVLMRETGCDSELPDVDSMSKPPCLGENVQVHLVGPSVGLESDGIKDADGLVVMEESLPDSKAEKIGVETEKDSELAKPQVSDDVHQERSRDSVSDMSDVDNYGGSGRQRSDDSLDIDFKSEAEVNLHSETTISAQSTSKKRGEASFGIEKVDSLPMQLGEFMPSKVNLELLTLVSQGLSSEDTDPVTKFDASSDPMLENIPSQPLVSKFLPQGSNHFDFSDEPTDHSPSISSNSFSLPTTSDFLVEEMPPLPPVQWRMSKIPHPSTAQESSSVQHRDLTPLFQSGDWDAQLLNVSMLPSTSGHERSLPFSEHAADEVPCSGMVSIHVEAIADPGDPTVTSRPSEGNLYSSFLHLPGAHSDILPYSYQSPGEEQSSLASLQQLPTKDTASENCYSEHTKSISPMASVPSSAYEVLRLKSQISDVGGSIYDNGQLLSRMEDNLPQQSMVGSPSGLSFEKSSQYTKEVSHEVNLKEERVGEGSELPNTIMMSDNTIPQPLKMEKGQPKLAMSTMESPLVWPAVENYDQESGNRAMKLPRPRNPLIDAVVALDKSKLRKVMDRGRREVEKVDDRDSILEQIRTKSFNLKPAAVSRPSIQGPKTNLKVAAILEKAKTIRQAFAGSDEDDDDDSWSDS